MKITLISLLLLLWFQVVGQDMLYYKNGSAIVVKVISVGVDLIKYKRLDIKKSPTYEIQKDDIYKIKYRQGEFEILDQKFNKEKARRTKPESLIYVVYNSQGTNIEFPLVLNNEYMFILKDRSRAAIKIHSEGEMIIIKKGFISDYEPSKKFVAVNGNTYALEIKVINTKTRDPLKMFSMSLYQDSLEVANFIKSEYSSFSPDGGHDFRMSEE